MARRGEARRRRSAGGLAVDPGLHPARASRGHILGPTRRLLGCSLLVLALLPGCVGAGSVGPAPEASVATEPADGEGATPVLRSRYPRSGRFSYHLVGLRQRDGGARVELRIHNGTARDHGSVMMRVIVVGRPGEWRSVPLPTGAWAAGRARTVSAWLPEVPFRVRDVHLELMYALP